MEEASLAIPLQPILTYLPPRLARGIKKAAVYPRFTLQARACRDGFRKFGDRYPQKILFIAGLPKSGTTWLKKMVSSYPGYSEILIPDVTAYELGSGGSHDYDLPANAFARFDRMLAVTKMHVHGSVHNVGILRAANVKHVVLFRDLRDVAVSYVYYVRQTPWHPEQPIYKSLSTREGLAKFAERTLPAYADWVRSWQKHRDPRASLILRYEEMLADTPGLTARVAHHFGLDSSPKTISRIVQVHSFQRLSKGRQQGEESQCSFFRKGVSGDWKNHFSPALKDIYKRLIGDFLIEFGYEQDYSW